MAAHIEIGPRALREEPADDPPGSPSSPVQGAGDEANERGPGSPPQDRSVIERFMQNFILALGAWPT